MKVCLNATFFKEEPKVDLSVTHNLTYGLFLLTCKDGERHNGCIINTAFQVAADPLQIAISSQNGNYSREIIENTKQFNLSVLTDDVPFDLIKRFGMQSGKDVDKFEDFDGVKTTSNGLKALTKYTNATISVKVNKVEKLSTHTLFIGEVTESQKLNGNPSCTYAHYHKNIKQKF